MTNQKPDNGPPTSKGLGDVSSSAQKKQSRPLLIIFLVFFIFLVIVFLTQDKDTIDWIEDYETGIELAKKQNKPVLLAFYNQDISFCWRTKRGSYNNPKVIKYVEANFIPILIDVDKQPEIVQQYNVKNYPTHYVEDPHSGKLSNPLIGCMPIPSLFIERIDHLLNTMKESDK